MFRQGDVLIRRIQRIPQGAKRQVTEGRIVLAYGEVTGHCHVLHEEAGDYKVKQADGTVAIVTTKGGKAVAYENNGYIHIEGEVALLHTSGIADIHVQPAQTTDHYGQILLPGDYERIIQREYAPEAIRNVQD